MNRSIIHNNIHYLLAILIAFSLPLAKVTPVLIVLLVINWVLEGDFSTKFKALKSHKLALLFIAVYCMLFISFILTDNIPHGLNELQVKASLLLFPIVLATKPFNNQQTKTIFKSFIIGCTIACCLMLINSFRQCLSFRFEVDFFTYDNLSYYMHTSYMSMYLNTTIAWLLLQLIIKSNDSKSFINYSILFLVLFFSLFVILLASKLGIITLVFIYTSILVYLFFKGKRLISLAIATILSTLLVITLSLSIRLQQRFTDSITTLTHSTERSTERYTVGSTSMRMFIWECANELISENVLFGVGTGDAEDELVKKYTAKNLVEAQELKLNAHNEYYQIFIAQGIIGFILFISSLLIPLYLSIKKRNYMYLSFLLIVMLNFIPESMLLRQSGVMFYAFFNALLCFQIRPQQ